MDTRTWRQRDEHQSLSAAARELLRVILLRPMMLAGFILPPAARELTQQGLAFHAHGRLSVTERGVDIGERVC